MELFFAQASTAVEIFGFGYVASSFVVYTHRRLVQPPGWRSHQASVAKAKSPVYTPPETRKPLTVEQLRQQCQQAGIKWRNAHGKNKHLKKAEMIAALEVAAQSKRPHPSQSPPVETRRKRAA